MKIPSLSLPADMPKASGPQCQCQAPGCRIPADIGLNRKYCRFHFGAPKETWPVVTARANAIRPLFKYATALMNWNAGGYDAKKKDELAEDFNHVIDELGLSDRMKALLTYYKGPDGKEMQTLTDPYLLGFRLLAFLESEVKKPSSDFSMFQNLLIQSRRDYIDADEEENVF